MAVSSSNLLSEVERFWYETRVTGATRTTPFNDLKLSYWRINLGFSGTYRDLEKQFLRKIITDQGATPSNTRYTSTLLKEALAALGERVGSRLTENWLTLYKNYNP